MADFDVQHQRRLKFFRADCRRRTWLFSGARAAAVQPHCLGRHVLAMSDLVDSKLQIFSSNYPPRFWGSLRNFMGFAPSGCWPCGHIAMTVVITRALALIDPAENPVQGLTRTDSVDFRPCFSFGGIGVGFSQHGSIPHDVAVVARLAVTRATFICLDSYLRQRVWQSPLLSPVFFDFRHGPLA